MDGPAAASLPVDSLAGDSDNTLEGSSPPASAPVQVALAATDLYRRIDILQGLTQDCKITPSFKQVPNS